MSIERSRRGFSVRVFLPGGDPAGMKVVEKSNWTGCGLVIPRALFAEAKIRPELERAGVYFLVGEAELGPLPQVYVGEGDPVRPRLDMHAKTKDFWTHAIVFTSKDQNLNKAHVQHLEARLVKLAAAAKRCTLDNGNIPQPPSLSEADTAEVEGFLDDVLLCLPTLGFGFFERRADAPQPATATLHLRLRGIEAQGFESAAGFVVLAGGQASKTETDSCHSFLRGMRAELIRQGVLVDQGSYYTLVQDYTFASPSSASGVLLGRVSNGRRDWKTEDGRTLQNLQDREPPHEPE